MASYTVKAGDNLSTIAKTLGVDQGSITGYRSGNPNLIYAGETLNYGGNPAPAAAPAPAAQQASSGSWRDKANAYNSELETFDKTAKSAIDIYNETMAKYGIEDARARVTSMRQALTNTDNAIRMVEGDVQARTQEANLSENQRRRVVQMDQAPLVEQARVQGQEFTGAQQDLSMTTEAAKGESDITIQSQKDRRDALLERYQLAVKEADSEEERQRAEREYQLKKQQFDEQIRQFEKSMANSNAQAALDRKTAAAKSSASSGGGYTTARTSSGGMNFYDSKGKPATAAQYAAATGKTIVQVLKEIGTAGAQKVISEINSGASIAELKSKYSYVFGGV